ncbi:dynein light chain family protein [Candidatus Bathyarchaeota archaeon]|nr:dynein light chain family protein [Candidatus Bathyarchaeota archaeon]
MLTTAVGHCAAHQEDCQLAPTTSASDVANFDQFDERKGPTWHCIVGRNFGSFVTHGTCLRSVRPATTSMPAANCNYRDEALPLLLPRPLRHPLVQDPVGYRLQTRGFCAGRGQDRGQR